jgi:O-antigen ligase
MHSNGLENPNAGIIRSLYETGVIGTLLFIAVFLTPIKKMYMNNIIHSKLIIFMLLMLGMYFAHRSAIPYIFLGMTLVVLKNKSITSGSTS